MNQGNGLLAAPADYSIYSVSKAGMLAVADIDGDGRPDFLIGETNGFGGVTSMLNVGNGTFVQGFGGAYYPLDPVAMTATDIDGDGKVDLAASTASGHVAVMLGGGGEFIASFSYAVGASLASITTADVDGDGKPDIVVANAGNSSVDVLVNQGAGSFAPAVHYPGSVGPHSSFATADFNGDGKVDVVVTGDSIMSVYLNQGGVFAPALTYIDGRSAGPIVAADLNGDGRPDVATVLSFLGVGGPTEVMLQVCLP